MPETDKTKNQTQKNPPVIPVYGSAKQIVNAFHNMALPKAKIAASPPTPPAASASSNPQDQKLPFGGFLPKPPLVRRSWFLTILLFFAGILSITIFFFLPRTKLPFQDQTLNLDSAKDKRSLETIKSITGFNWQTLKGETGTKEERLAAILMLHEEESATFSLFTGKNPVLATQSLKNLNLGNVNEEVSKDSIQKLIENLIMTQELQKGNNEAQIHIDRLKILEGYFQKYQPSETDAIPSGADTITLDSHPADNQKALTKLILQRYNIFVKTYDL